MLWRNAFGPPLSEGDCWLTSTGYESFVNHLPTGSFCRSSPCDR